MTLTRTRRGSVRRVLATGAAAGLGVVLLAGPAAADTVAASGDTTGSPTFNRPVTCTTLSGVGTAVHYRTHALTVGSDGAYVIASETVDHDGVLTLYAAPFDPASPLDRCLAHNDDFGDVRHSRISTALTAGSSYVIVQSEFSNGVSGTYELQVSGPGAVTLEGGVPDLPTPVVPEVPLALLLPLAAASIGAVALRRRPV